MVKDLKMMSGVIHKVGVWENFQQQILLIDFVMHIFGLRYQVNQMVSVMVGLKQECFGENKRRN
jgi:hypothetical protein